jgi:cyclic pyranopterin monophosphate synthase
MKKITHLNSKGEAVMVNVVKKQVTMRTAEAFAEVILPASVFKMVVDNNITKGDVLTVAKIAGIQGAKKTSGLIPLCHNISLDNINIELIPDENKNSIKIYSTAVTEGKTGVEMEALTGASIAALTIYDMCKGADKSIIISEIKLLSKSGGKSGDYRRED